MAQTSFSQNKIRNLIESQSFISYIQESTIFVFSFGIMKNLVFLFLLVVGAKAVVNRLQGNFGIFASPGFPTPYANDLNDSWIITVQQGYRVKLYFTFFDLEDSYVLDRCDLDYVEVCITPFKTDIYRRPKFCPVKVLAFL